LTAIASAGGQSVDVTTSVTWQANPSTLVTLEQQTDPMCVTAGSTAGTATIYATYVSGSNVVTSNSITVTVTQ
jgi:hypothetical protein